MSSVTAPNKEFHNAIQHKNLTSPQLFLDIIIFFLKLRYPHKAKYYDSHQNVIFPWPGFKPRYFELQGILPIELPWGKKFFMEINAGYFEVSWKFQTVTGEYVAEFGYLSLNPGPEKKEMESFNPSDLMYIVKFGLNRI